MLFLIGSYKEKKRNSESPVKMPRSPDYGCSGVESRDLVDRSFFM